MSRFKTGDRVKYVGTILGNFKNQCGTVVGEYSGHPSVSFEQMAQTVTVFDASLIAIPDGPTVWHGLAGKHRNVLPENDAERGAMLMADGLLDYFPNALAAIAVHSVRGNAKHNPGEPLHWARDKSTDHRNKIVRHLVDAGGVDGNGDRHSAALAWRTLALLEDELIAAGAVPGRNAIGTPAVLPNKQQSPRDVYETAHANNVAHNCIEDET